MNENLNLGHSNNSSRPSSLHPSPPLETAGISNSQRPVLAESYVSGFQSSATLLHERTQTEENNTGTSAVPPDPLQNELTRIHLHIEMRTKVKEENKLKIKLECEQELEKVQKKHNALLEEDKREFDEDMKYLEMAHSKLVMNQKLAKQFRYRWMDRKRPERSGFADQGHPLGPTPQFHNEVDMPWASPSAPGPQMQMPQVHPTAAGPSLPLTSSSTMVRHDSLGTPNQGT